MIMKMVAHRVRIGSPAAAHRIVRKCAAAKHTKENTMKTTSVSAICLALAISLIQAASFADAPKTQSAAAHAKKAAIVKKVAHVKKAPIAMKKAVAATQYECTACHMRYSAADAKKYNYKDPMDGGKLVPVTK
jgi:hypothetical protein